MLEGSINVKRERLTRLLFEIPIRIPLFNRIIENDRERCCTIVEINCRKIYIFSVYFESIAKFPIRII